MPNRAGSGAEEDVPRAAWRLLAFLTLLNVLNFVDRMLITSLAPLLIRDLGLTRAEIGLLAGFGFVVFYSAAGLLLGLAADRWPRIPLVAAGLAVWSAMTALSGFARAFLHLALPRVLVGAGEATLAPAALSMIDDAFPRRRLGLATGIYYAGIPLGSGCGLVLAGFLAPRLGWRACFWALGALGVVAAVALLAVREPARRSVRAQGPAPRLGELARQVRATLATRPELVLVLAGGALLVYGSASAMHVLTWLVEERGYEFRPAALAAGLVAFAGGLAGNLSGGAFGDRWARAGAGGRLRSLAALTLLSVPATLVFYLAEPGTAAFHLGWLLAAAGASAFFGPLFAAIQELAPAAARASTVAFGLLALNVTGVGLGPLVTGAIGDARSLTAGLVASQGVVALAIVPFAFAARRAARTARSGSGG
jgi:predicted MFS family arabinose efflux permease